MGNMEGGPAWQRSGLAIVVLRSQGTSIWFSGTLAVKLSDPHAASVVSDPAMLEHNNDSRGFCSTQGVRILAGAPARSTAYSAANRSIRASGLKVASGRGSTA